MLVDQLTKQLVVSHLRFGESTTLVADVLSIRHIRNPMGLLHALANVSAPYGAIVFLSAPLMILACLLLTFRKFDGADVRTATALGLVMGGQSATWSIACSGAA